VRSLSDRFPDTNFKVLVQAVPSQDPSPCRSQVSCFITGAFNDQGPRLLQTWERSVQNYYINPGDVREIDLIVVYITYEQKPNFDIRIDKGWFSKHAPHKLTPEEYRTRGLANLIGSDPVIAPYSPKVGSGNEVDEVLIRAAVHVDRRIVLLLPRQDSERERKIDAGIMTNFYPHYHVKFIWLQEPHAKLFTSTHDPLKDTIAEKVTNRTHSIM
jgi:hypothetical protein